MTTPLVDGDGAGVTLSSGQYIAAILLRDSCICSDCRRPATNERLLDSASIDPDLRIAEVVDVAGQRITVLFSDGHRGHHDLDLIPDDLRAAELYPMMGYRPWRGLDDDDFEFRFDTLTGTTANPDEQYRWLDGLVKYGVSIVHGVPPTGAGLAELVQSVGPIQATNYGVIWDIEATIAPVAEVESEHQLRVHTDLPYRSAVPGVQFLLAAVTDVDGGASTVVDGFLAAEALRRSDPEAWRLLTEVEWTYPFVRELVEFRGQSPIISMTSGGGYSQVRWAPDLRGVPLLDDQPAGEVYAALRSFDELVNDPSRLKTIRLDPGDALVIDNHRILHGRTAFELGSSGRRHLLGCYADMADVRSRLAVLSR